MISLGDNAMSQGPPAYALERRGAMTPKLRSLTFARPLSVVLEPPAEMAGSVRET